MSCRVLGCRFSTFHTTRSHQCGRCNKMGHGQLECGNDDKLMKLAEHMTETLPQSEWCKFDYCDSRQYHTTNSHFCDFCDTRHDDIYDCLYKDAQRTSELINIDVEGVMRSKVDCFALHGLGMGNSMIIRNRAGIIESFYMHSDVWGQYGNGPKLNHRPLYESFIYGLMPLGSFQDIVDQTTGNFGHYNPVKCPICRTESNKEDIITIKGLSETCKVCLVNEIEKCFTNCNHACVCGSCLERL